MKNAQPNQNYSIIDPAEQKIKAAVLLYKQVGRGDLILLTKSKQSPHNKLHFKEKLKSHEDEFVFPTYVRSAEDNSEKDAIIQGIKTNLGIDINKESLAYVTELITKEDDANPSEISNIQEQSTIPAQKYIHTLIYASPFPKPQEPLPSEDIESLIWTTPRSALIQEKAGLIKLAPDTRNILYTLTYLTNMFYECEEIHMTNITLEDLFEDADLK